MKHQDGYFKNQENQSIYFQNWLPEDPAKAVFLIVHGINEHSGRYDRFSNFFVNEGFAVYSMDLIGHGKSDGTRSYVKDFNNYLDDIILYLEKIKQLQPGSPIFLIGHSIGGLIATLLLIDHPEQFAGAVLSGSAVQVPDDVSPLFISLGKFVSFVLPKLGLLKIDLSGLSRNPAVVQDYKDDPLVNSGKFTARISAEINKSFDRVAGEGSQVKAPVLILHGGSDRIVNPACSHFLYALFSSEIKKLIIYDDFYHEIYNDPNYEQVYNDVSSWINNQLK
jgi:alpha-beta hydrolase superfamily lysophospholipase